MPVTSTDLIEAAKQIIRQKIRERRAATGYSYTFAVDTSPVIRNEVTIVIAGSYQQGIRHSSDNFCITNSEFLHEVEVGVDRLLNATDYALGSHMIDSPVLVRNRPQIDDILGTYSWVNDAITSSDLGVQSIRPQSTRPRRDDTKDTTEMIWFKNEEAT